MPESAGQVILPDSSSVVVKINEVLTKVRQKGYLLAEIAKVEWNKKQTIAFINPGKRFNISQISPGNVAINLLSEAGYSVKELQSKSFSTEDIDKLFERLLQGYADGGYPFAVLGFDSVEINNTNIKTSLFVDKGALITFDTLQLAGDVKISRKYLESFLNVKEGSVFKQSSLDAIERRIKELSFISLVKLPMVKFVGSKAKLTLFLEKQSTNQFDGILGFLPDNKTDKLQFVGDLKLHLQNSFKKAEQFDFNYKGLPERSKELNLGFGLTELFSSPLGVDLSFHLYKQSLNYQNIQSRASLNYRLSRGRLSFILHNRSGLVMSSDTVNSNLNLATSSAMSYGIGFLYQTLNSTVQPTRGFSVNFTAESGKRRVSEQFTSLNNSDLGNSQYRIDAKIEFYRPISLRNVLKLNSETGVLIGKNLFENELYRIGGFGSIKGFNEQSLLANSYTYFNAEYRLRIENTSYLFAFINQGFLIAHILSSETKDSPLGFGAGINLRVKTGMFSLSYALGKQKDNPLNLQSGKIHFGLITLF